MREQKFDIVSGVAACRCSFEVVVQIIQVFGSECCGRCHLELNLPSTCKMPRRVDGHPEDCWSSVGEDHLLFWRILCDEVRYAAADVLIDGGRGMKLLCGLVPEAEKDLRFKI